MLREVCEHLHNFDFDRGREVHDGEFTIEEGMISLPFSMLEGQRFLISGSVLNVGMYTWHAAKIKNDDDDAEAGLQDETFAGTISALAVPPPVIALSGEISEWVEKYGEVVDNPLQSESVIGVYSYTKASGSNASGASEPITWQSKFRSRLDRWRRMNF